MRTDLVLSPFDAHAPDMLAAARIADEGGFDGVWTYDHFSATMLGRGWSHHPFAALGAIAAVTDRIRIGCLMANMTNRHPVQVASALGTLSSLAPGRVVCGIGAGAGPGSVFSGEQQMIAQTLDRAPVRRRALIEHIAGVRAAWSGADVDGEHIQMTAPSGIVPPGPMPPVIVGASTATTALIAAEHADGVNLRRSEELRAHVEAVQSRLDSTSDFEISVNDDLDLTHATGGPIDDLLEMGIERRTLAIQAPYDLDALARIAAALSESS